MEKEFTLNNATLVWWFITWRTALLGIIMSIIFMVVNLFLPQGSSFLGGFLPSLLQWAAYLVAIISQILFTKMAVNRAYISKSNGSFRLSARELEQTQPESSPAPTPQM